MPRGTCEHCGGHDAFVYPVPLTFGRNVFVCARCLTLPRECDGGEDDENANSNYCPCAWDTGKWQSANREAFAQDVAREVPCDWQRE